LSSLILISIDRVSARAGQATYTRRLCNYELAK
jgi:hypothetical protein